MRKRGWIVWIAAALAAGCGGAEETTGSSPEPSPEMRQLMGRIYEGLRVALPASAGEEPFSDAARRADVAAALDLLYENAARIESHGSDDVTRHLARSVARDAREVRDAYAEGHYGRAGYLLRQISEHCVNCHARLPDAEDHPLAKGLLDDVALSALSADERATLQIATRRFDDALDTMEGILASADSPVLMLGTLVDYLVVNVRVRGDFERPIPVLRRFAERPDLWAKLRSDVRYWIDALPSLARQAEGEPRLEVAREILAEARGAGRFPGGQRAVAHFVVASSVLERFLASHFERDARAAEAYFRLGLIEAWIGRNYWVSSAPYLLESAIRVAPEASFAERAYEILEQELVLTYEGADEELPADDRERLAELRALIDGA